MTHGNESSGHLKNTVRAQRMLKENEVKISKKRKMAKNHFSRADFGSLGDFLGVLGASLY